MNPKPLDLQPSKTHDNPNLGVVLLLISIANSPLIGRNVDGMRDEQEGQIDRLI